MLELIPKAEVKLKISQDAEFPYFELGRLSHHKPDLRVWVSHKLLSIQPLWQERVARTKQVFKGNEALARLQELERSGGKYEVRFPANAAITITTKGSLVLKPSPEKITIAFSVPCGYRGSSSFEIQSEVEFMREFQIYHSPRGSLGISAGAIVTVREKQWPIKVRWCRTGRLYGEPAEGIALVHIDRIEEFEGVSDFNELDELASELEG